MFCIYCSSFAQKGWKLGFQYTLANSQFYGVSYMPNTDPNFISEFKPKNSFGTGIDINYSISEKWSLGLQTSYQQRGAFFDVNTNTFKPRYKLSYMDNLLYIKHYSKPLIRNVKGSILLGANANILLNASRQNSYGSTNTSSETNMMDYAATVALGIVIPRLEKDAFEIQVFGSPSFSSVFIGDMPSAKNMLYGIRLNYLLGLKK